MGSVRSEELLEQARARLGRLDPDAAWDACRSGAALLVDIRSEENRARAGVVPGSVHVPRTVLEWRLDPESPWRNPHVAGTARRLIVLCDHGWSSSLVAATLQEHGYADATDVVGGAEAWRAAGLPLVEAADELAPGELPGMRAPEPLS